VKEHKTNHIKNLVIIMTGIIVSLAGIVYIVVQYSKLLTALFMKNEEDDESGCDTRLKHRFCQVETDEGSTPPDTLEDDDLSVDLPET